MTFDYKYTYPIRFVWDKTYFYGVFYLYSRKLEYVTRFSDEIQLNYNITLF